MILNSVISSGGDVNKSQIIVTTDSGSVVTCTKGSVVKNARENNGQWRFTGIDIGTWTVRAQKDGMETSANVEITRLTVEYVNLVYRKVPEFTYTGDYELVNDDDTPLTDYLSENWKLRLLSSGTLIFQELGAGDGNIDVFLVGAGGGGNHSGGGGGKTTTSNATIKTNFNYTIVIGAGSKNAAGGESSAFGLKAAGGGVGSTSQGGSGGSGGGGYGGTDAGSDGGSDGSAGGDSLASGGTGQGTTTREFGESGGTLYAGGGGGGGANTSTNPSTYAGGAGGDGGGGRGGKPSCWNGDTTVDATDGTVNTGGGGGGQCSSAGSAGGSGIVVIRNKR